MFIALLASGFTVHAITNTAIAISGTNIVLSWPSFGYESYLVQYRQTLDPTDSWLCLTNAYHANSASRTTFTNYGVVPAPSGGNGGSFASLAAAGNAYNSMMAATGPLATPADGSGGPVPVAIYPPGFDLSGFTIFDPTTGESVSGADYAQSPLSQRTRLSADAPFPSGDPQPMDSGSGGPSAPTTGFFEVFHIPGFLANFSGYTFNGPTFIPVDYAAPDADLDHVEDTTVLIGGQPTDHAQFMSYDISGVTYWGVAVYFDRFPNGTNTIQLITTVRQSDVINDQTPYMVFSNAPAAINIGNLVTYTNWDDLIASNGYTIKAQSSVPNVNWEIDIYDWNGNFVNYQTGYSTDGNISWTWNLVDYWGNPRGNFDSDPAFFPYITITGNLPAMAQNSGAQPNAGSSSASAWTPPFGNQYPSIGGWIISYMDRFYLDGTPDTFADSCMHSGLNDLTGGPAEWNDPVVQYPLKFGLNYLQSDRDNSWTNFATYLYYSNNRNLYYFGHGNANSIGGDYSITDTNGKPIGATLLPGSKAEVTARYIHDKITFNHDTGPRRYRFIYLDCCNGAAANSILPWAFDVPKQQEPLSYYHTASNTSHGRPSAFVGWDTEVGGPGWGSVNNFWSCRSYWMGDWAGFFQANLDDALYNGNDFSGWVSASQFYGHIHIYGYSIMMLDEYNFGGDWIY